jgi:hypothetical protein
LSPRLNIPAIHTAMELVASGLVGYDLEEAFTGLDLAQQCRYLKTREPEFGWAQP